MLEKALDQNRCSPRKLGMAQMRTKARLLSEPKVACLLNKSGPLRRESSDINIAPDLVGTGRQKGEMMIRS